MISSVLFWTTLLGRGASHRISLGSIVDENATLEVEEVSANEANATLEVEEGFGNEANATWGSGPIQTCVDGSFVHCDGDWTGSKCCMSGQYTCDNTKWIHCNSPNKWTGKLCCRPGAVSNGQPGYGHGQPGYGHGQPYGQPHNHPTSTCVAGTFTGCKGEYRGGKCCLSGQYTCDNTKWIHCNSPNQHTGKLCCRPGYVSNGQPQYGGQHQYGGQPQYGQPQYGQPQRHYGAQQGQFTWVQISGTAACETNGDGIKRSKGLGYNYNLNSCKNACAGNCQAIDFYQTTGWCNLYNAPCHSPRTYKDGATSWRKNYR